ncbi:MAG: TIGR03936 family radical SAM-associated protein [Candidatus Omnitrophota bacterium]
MNIRYNTVFSKKGDMVYISHLDLMTLFRRAIRRADFPFFLTGGFSPRVKISMPKALKLGVESDCEEMSMWLTENVPEKIVEERMNFCLPEGVRILKVFK